MVKIDLLRNHPICIPVIANIWYELLGKIWMPEITLDEIEFFYNQELKNDIPITYIALYNNIPVGSCTFELDGGIRPDLQPWVGDLVVDKLYQGVGIGQELLNTVTKMAAKLGFEKLYLFTFDTKTASYYERFGWSKIALDQFKSQPVIVMEVVL